MLSFLFFIVCFLASTIGAVCGIGGGVVIKPVLDAIGALDVDAVSFLSGCTVLSMTAYSVLAGKVHGNSTIKKSTGIPLSLGAVAGGLLGKWLFSYLLTLSSDKNKVGAVQAACLMLVTIGTLIYTLYKNRVRGLHVKNRFCCVIIGVALGIMSSFLGIGGGPINLIVLFYFFSMPTKTAAENSLYIIFFSQTASLLSSVITGNIPQFSAETLILMIAGGIGGGICGRVLNKKLTGKTVDKLFIGMMVVIILICIYNVHKFLVVI